jgi:hypothetical protein
VGTIQCTTFLGDDKDLAQGKRHPLAKLVGGGESVLPPGLMPRSLPPFVPIPGFQLGTPCIKEGSVIRGGQSDLLVDPRRVGGAGHRG